jgi:hypothetical protein
MKLRVALLGMVLLLFTGTAEAQVLYGSLTGNVKDASGAVLPGARVAALNVNTGVARQVTADNKGVYLFPELLPGTYKVTVSASGFTTVETDNVRVDQNTERRVDAQLAVAKQLQTIEVTGAPPALQTDRADLHTDVQSSTLSDIPLTSSAGRSFQSIYKIIPGFGLTQEANSAGGNPQRATTTNVNGGSSQDNATRIDGVLDTYIWLPANVAYVPPVDSIETVNITTNSYDAEQGATAGSAAVNVVTKSGTNQFHGEGYEFTNDESLRARNFFNPVGYHKPKDIMNQFGGNVGGPIKKNKLFFFGDFERTVRRQFAARYESIANPAAIFDSSGNANFSEVIPSGTNCNTTYTVGCIYDPNTGTATGTGRTAFTNNTIPASRIDPAAKQMLSLIDTSGFLGSGLVTAGGYGQYANNYYGSHPAAFNRNTIDSKINYIPSQKAMLFARYSISQAAIMDTMMLGPAGGDSTGGGQPGEAPSRIQALGMGGTYSLSPNTLIDVNAGYTRQRLGAQGQDIALGQFGVNTLHIPGTNGPDAMQAGIPAFQFGSFWGNLGNPNTGSPFLFRDNSYVVNTNLSKTKGAHDIRLGFEYTRGDINHFQPQGGSFQTARGTFRFQGQVTALNATGAAAANYVNSLAQFLLGLPYEVGKAVQVTDPIGIRWRTFGLYVRDRWQATSKLTVNYGVRWEFYPFGTADHGGLKWFDPTTGNVYIGGNGSVPVNDGVDTGHGQFLPRLGLAYRLTSKTVLRAGYGMSADSNNWRFFRNNYPNTTNSDVLGPSLYYPAASLTGETLTPYPTLTAGIPAVNVPSLSSGVVPLPTGVGLGADTVPKNFRRGYFHSYNLTVQREFAGFVAEAAYVGTRGIRAPTNQNLNAAPAGGGSAGRYLNALFNANCSSSPTVNCWSDINSFSPHQNTYYDALQTRISRRMGSGNIVGFVYTWSKSIDSEDNEELASLSWPYPAYYNRNKALAGFDRPSNSDLYGVYALPFGKTKRWATSGIANKLAGGWQANWVLTRASGTPMTLTGGGSSLNAPGNTETVNQVGPSTLVKGIGPVTGQPACPATTLSCHYFDPSAFTGVATGTVAFGNTGRDIIRGPGFFDLDASLFRDFRLTERFKLQIRAECFSLTNTPHFANPGTTWTSGSTTFGVITSTFNQSNQMAGSGGERWLWLSGKVIF